MMLDRNTIERAGREWTSGSHWRLVAVAIQTHGTMVAWEACAAAPGTPPIGIVGVFMSNN